MTLNTTSMRTSAIGNGTTKTFSFAFQIFVPADLLVLIVHGSIETVLSYPSQYTVLRTQNGGSITCAVAPLAGDTIVILRIRPLSQDTSIRNQGAYYAETHENTFDKLAMVDQQQQDQLERSLHLSRGTDPAVVSAALPTPDPGKFLGWNPTGTGLINSPAGAQGPMGPAGVGGPIPVFDTSAARDAFYPAPADNNMARNRQTGFTERWGTPPIGGAKRWLPQESTHEIGPVVSVRARGAFADGGHDDRAALANADALVTTSGVAELEPGTYRVDSNLTLSGGLRINNGAVLQPSNGVTVTLAGGLDDLIGVKFFDTSLGGHVVIDPNNKKIRKVRPEYWGAMGLNTVDEAPAWNEMLASIPNNCLVEPPPWAVYRINSTMVATGRFQVIIDSGLRAGYDSGLPEFLWYGASGGFMAAFDRCRFCEWNGCNWTITQSGHEADAVMVFSGWDVINYLDVNTGIGHGIGSACAFKRNKIFMGFNRSTFVAVDIGRYADIQNWEYCDISDNLIFNTGGVRYATGTMGALSPNLSVTSGTFVAGAMPTGDVGRRTRVAGTGANGGPLDVAVLSVTNSTNVVLNANSVGGQTGVKVMVGEDLGIAIRIGPNSNAKRQKIQNNQINDWAIGIQLRNGSFFSQHNSIANCEINIQILASSEPTMEVVTNSEGSRCHFDSPTGVTAHRSLASRYDVNNCIDKFINNVQTNGFVTFSDFSFENSPPVGGAIFYTNQSGRLIAEGPNFGSGGIPWAQIVHPLSAPVEFQRLTDGALSSSIPDWQRSQLASGLVVRSGGATGAQGVGTIKGVASADGSIGSGLFGGIEATAEWVNGAGFQYETPLFISTMLKLGKRTWGSPHILGHDIRMPNMNVGDAVYKVTGMRIVPPTIAGGSSINNGTGIEIGDMKGAGVGAVAAIDQLGPADPNKFAGPVRVLGAFERTPDLQAIGAGGTYTADPKLHSDARLTCAGNVTVANPSTTPTDGARFSVTIFNNTAGAITVTQGGKWKGTFTPPGAGLRSTQDYAYHLAVDAYYPTHAQSVAL